jgi:L,D-peptidoglycan transpeptidase YkuD (ErfK/YbiS/YcfS/YnhG family)
VTARWTVKQSRNDKSIGILSGPDFEVKCAIGREGVATQYDMCEGDFKTPLGVYPLRKVYYRKDKILPPETELPVHVITQNCGWCDAPAHPFYNKYVKLPFEASHEQLWRPDDTYDLIVVMGHNDSPVVVGKGSAVFIHVAREGFWPTAGCIALELTDLQKLIGLMGVSDTVEIIGA